MAAILCCNPALRAATFRSLEISLYPEPLPDRTEHSAQLDLPGLPAPPVQQVHKVRSVPSVLRVQLVQQVHKVLRGRPEQLELKGYKARKVSLEPLDRRVPRAQSVQWVPSARRELQARQVSSRFPSAAAPTPAQPR